MATFIGDARKNKITGTLRADQISGLAGDDTLIGGGGNDLIKGGTGNDQIRGDAGNDKLLGEAGNDILRGGTGNDSLDGGIGNDQLLGEVGNDVLTGGAGIDSLDGGSESDVLIGGADADTLLGGLGNDVLAPGAGTDTIDGGAGVDALSYADATSAVTLALTLAHSVTVGGAAAGDTATNIEGLIGSAFSDTLTLMQPGADTDSFAYGGAGNDSISVGASNAAFDTFVRVLRGDAGNDILRGDTSTTGNSQPTTDHFWLQYDKGYDIIRFMNSFEDKFLISASEFNLSSSLVGQALPAAQFLSSTDSLPTTALHQFIFETDTRILWCDKDGTGDTFAAIPIARLDNGAPFALTGTDFLIIA